MKDNNSIECSMGKCEHHSKTSNYCTLKKIKVNKDNRGANDVSIAECANFEVDI